jgi:hypothetical protein
MQSSAKDYTWDATALPSNQTSSFGEEREFVASDWNPLRRQPLTQLSIRGAPSGGTLTTAFSHSIEPWKGGNLFNFAHFLKEISSFFTRGFFRNRRPAEKERTSRGIFKTGLSLQAAEEFLSGRQKCQGTTSVVPQVQWNQCGLQPLRVAFLKSFPISYPFPQPL